MVLGTAIQFENAVLRELYGDNAQLRTHYVNYDSLDIDTFNQLNVSSYLKEGDEIQRTKFGFYVSENEDTLRTDSIDGDNPYTPETGDNYADWSDLLIGHTANDTLISGGGRDFLFGGDGDDQMFAGEGNDVLVGGEQADKLSGGIGEDELFGEAGDDTLEGGVRSDLMPEDVTTFFDSFTTTLYYDDEESDILDGGDGHDDYYVYHVEKYITDTTNWENPHSGANPYSFFDAVFIASDYGATDLRPVSSSSLR